MKINNSLKYGIIGKKLYKDIVSTMPIPCVDLLLVHKNNFLLGLRKNKPLKNEWCFSGGRILKEESFNEAIYRKLKDETGLNKKVVRSINLLTVKDVFYPDSEFGSSMHNINLLYKIQIRSSDNLKPDNQHRELRWFSRIDKKWPSYVKFGLKLAGFK